MILKGQEMNDKKNISDEELSELATKIARPTLEFFNRKLTKEMENFLRLHDGIHKKDIVRITSASIFDVLINVFTNIKNATEKEKLMTKTEFKKIILYYSTTLLKHFLNDKKDGLN